MKVRFNFALSLGLSLTGVLGGFTASAGQLPLAVRQQRLFEAALEQAQTLSPDWDPSQRDCAGFVRFLFRKASGETAYSWRNFAGGSNAYASAADLMGWNFSPLGRDWSKLQLQTGDVLAFRKPLQAPGEDWHLMVVLKAPKGVEARELVVYHNGSTGAAGGVRKLWLQDLQARESREWSVTPENPHFVGVFRHPEWFAPAASLRSKREEQNHEKL